MRKLLLSPSAPRLLLVWVLALAALLPFLGHLAAFGRLFWFADELDMVNEFDRLGFGRWLWLMFAENFVPLFKVLWGGLVFGGRGSYMVMLAVLWATHALNVGLLAAWMRRARFDAFAFALAGLVFGLSASNLETLTWSIQWSAVLAVTFFLLAGLNGSPSEEAGAPGRPRRNPLGVIIPCAASALVFSRGVLTGLIMGLRMLDPTLRPPARWSRRLLVAAGCAIPSLAVALVIYAHTAGAHPASGPGAAHWRDKVGFGLWFFSLNPIVPFLAIAPENWGIPAVGWPAVLLCGLGKAAVIAVALAWSSPAQRRMLAPLLALDLANACLLGYGRGEADLGHAMSSRYQYNALLCFAPFLGAALSRAADRLVPRGGLRVVLLPALLFLAAWESSRRWSALLPPWVEWRGGGSRRLLLGTNPVPPGYDLVGIPFLDNVRAKELVDKYNLH